MISGLVLLVLAVVTMLAVVVATPIALHARHHNDRQVYGVTLEDELLGEELFTRR